MTTAAIGSSTFVGTYNNALSITGVAVLLETPFVSNVMYSILVACCAEPVGASAMAIASHNNSTPKQRTKQRTVNLPASDSP